jgi:hypothetical protein
MRQIDTALAGESCTLTADSRRAWTKPSPRACRQWSSIGQPLDELLVLRAMGEEDFHPLVTSAENE